MAGISISGSPRQSMNSRQLLLSDSNLIRRSSLKVDGSSSNKIDGSPSRIKKKSSVRFRIPTRIDNLLESRVYSAYTKGRKDPREEYEECMSEREWWRAFVKETPVPGHYKYRDFLNDGRMNPIQATYNFAGQGRKREPGVSHRGDLLQPGLYEHSDFIQDMRRRIATYSFKSSGRARTPPGFQDKYLNVPPWRYNTTRKAVVRKRISSTLSSSFRSQSTRFPSQNFQPHEGPPPGAYDPCSPTTRYAVSSCFRSGTARFASSYTKVPGPGTYEPNTDQGRSGMDKTPSTITKMGRMHGLYFRNTFEA